MNKSNAVALLAVKAGFGLSLVFGFGSLPAGGLVVAHAADSDPGIVTDSTGQLRDCTVTDSIGNRADYDSSCDNYWAESAGYHDGLRAIVTQL